VAEAGGVDKRNTTKTAGSSLRSLLRASHESAAYKEKYNTPRSVQYVKDMTKKKSRDTTTELVVH
jgi:hypothetical protein